MTLNLRDIYKFYSKQVDIPLPLSLYLNIVNSFLQLIFARILSGDIVPLFPGFGSMGIIGRKQKPKIDSEGNILGLSPNWQKTYQLWKNNPQAKEEKRLIYNTNEETSGIRYKCKWINNKIMIANKSYYSFRLTMTNKRILAKVIQTGKEFLVEKPKLRVNMEILKQIRNESK